MLQQKCKEAHAWMHPSIRIPHMHTGRQIVNLSSFESSPKCALMQCKWQIPWHPRYGRIHHIRTLYMQDCTHQITSYTPCAHPLSSACNNDMRGTHAWYIHPSTANKRFSHNESFAAVIKVYDKEIHRHTPYLHPLVINYNIHIK